jgi:hypothetical protein
VDKTAYRATLKAYLDRKKEAGEPLPGVRGRLNYKGIVVETGIPARQFRPGRELRILLDAAAAEHTIANDSLYDQPHRFLDLERRAPSMTYKQLKAAGVAWLEGQNYAASTVGSYASHLKSYQRFLGRTNDDSTIRDFGVNFERQLRQFIQTTTKGKAVDSALRRWALIHYEVQKAKSLPQSFAAALTELVLQTGRSRRDIAQAAGISNLDTVGDWMRGDKLPTDLADVERVERELQVLPGTLTAKLDVSNKSRRSIVPKGWWPKRWLRSYASFRHSRDKVLALIPLEVLTGPLDELRPVFDEALQRVIEGEGEPDFRLRIREYRKKSYRLLFEKWPEPLQQEFMSLKEYKTAKTGFSNTKRRGRWKERTAQGVQIQLETFFGFLCLPSDETDLRYQGMGMALEDLTLGWLAVRHVVEKFLDFRQHRAGAHSGATESFINIFGSLLQPESGWLWLHPELMTRLPDNHQCCVQAIGGWESYCAKVHAELREALASLKRHREIKKTRDPFFPIAPILNLSEPLSAVNHALNLHRADLEIRSHSYKLFSKNLAANWRDHLIISLLARFPLRAKHWGMLTYNEEGTGNLRRHPTDGWQLVIPYADFKNVSNEAVFPPNAINRSLTLTFNQVPALQQLVPVLEFYLKHARPILAADGPLLFPKKEGGQMAAFDLFARIREWTHEYLSQHSSRGRGIKGVHAFGPHAFRDIVATHIIKTTGSLTLAANILLDSEETVKRHYARFLPEDRLALAMDVLTETFTRFEDLNL